ncbi:sulfate adenylyltransferase subunit CysD [Sandarakinorhabdus rubra]|uniref:sulfate adenylyltransferase subunit CysD n=1 Tax=Sandarakinorhabdus rubra TaxID=2672568 RepID=UPI0013DAFC58|nr:sulfate adenylyltransferase subunit CysD [Sandarakinorhabdus rubra]
MALAHLDALEAEAIHLMREVVAECRRPVMLWSVGKDSAVMLHLALKAFHPAPPPFPFLHVASGWDFADLIAHRDATVAAHGLDLIIASAPPEERAAITPFTASSDVYAETLLTNPLKAALAEHGFDAAFGGGRRDEERARAKERMVSLRSASQHWDPKDQRPELWNLYNLKCGPGESCRVFPLSNWTELDVWHYIAREGISIVPLYKAALRPTVERGGRLIVVDDDRMPPGEAPRLRMVRFRTLGCWPLTGAFPSEAADIEAIIAEMAAATTSERAGRLIDDGAAASMEAKKRAGYF